MEEQKGRVGIAVILAVLLASAVVSWTVSAMADDDGEGATVATSGTVPAEGEQEADPTDPENAKPFDGPKHKTYDASIDAPLSGTTHEVTLEVTEDTFEVADGMFMNLWTFGGKVPGPVIVIVEPKGEQLPPAREYAPVQSELYFGGQDKVGDLTKMTNGDPDWIVFNGYANQYIDGPLVADPGERVRLYLLNAGPSRWRSRAMPLNSVSRVVRHCYWRSPCSWSRSSLCSPVGRSRSWRSA